MRETMFLDDYVTCSKLAKTWGTSRQYVHKQLVEKKATRHEYGGIVLYELEEIKRLFPKRYDSDED